MTWFSCTMRAKCCPLLIWPWFTAFGSMCTLSWCRCCKQIKVFSLWRIDSGIKSLQVLLCNVHLLDVYNNHISFIFLIKNVQTVVVSNSTNINQKKTNHPYSQKKFTEHKNRWKYSFCFGTRTKCCGIYLRSNTNENIA